MEDYEGRFMQRQTSQRTAIETVFRATKRPLAPQEILDAARDEVPTLNLATVYRTLKRMVEDRFLHPVELPGEPARYELQEAADKHHHHFRCGTCDSVFDLKGCVNGLSKLLPAGFHMSGHDIVIYGDCRACNA